MAHECKTVGDFDSQLARAPRLVVVDFFATWCGPCQTMAPVFGALSEKYGQQALFLKVDGDSEAGDPLTERFQVEAFPTFVILLDGAEIGRVVGADEEQLEQSIQNGLKRL